MEELVGKCWHGLITQAACKHFPASAVRLDGVKGALATWYRALGGEPCYRIDAAIPRQLGQDRTVLQKIAGTNKAVAVASLEHDCLRLPGEIAVFPERGLNGKLYYWLSALAANSDFPLAASDWFDSNRAAVRATLSKYPGLVLLYRRLAASFFEHRMRAQGPAAVQREALIVRALQYPGEEAAAATEPFGLWVPLWLYPRMPAAASGATGATDANGDEPESGKKKRRNLEKSRGYRGERKAMPKTDDGLLATRLESLFSWTEYIDADRPVDEDEDDNAQRRLDDLDVVSLCRDNKTAKSLVKFDLDLPAEAEDQQYLEKGELQPEWDYRKRTMRAGYCAIQPMVSARAKPCPLPRRLFYKSRRLKAQFERLLMDSGWQYAQPEGSELDLDACLRLTADLASGKSFATENLYRRRMRIRRDLACLLLADVSFSTDAYVNDEQRIIDCIKDSLLLFSETLGLTGDEFAIQGFSSKNRGHVRVTWVKFFAERYTALTRGRIADLRPGFYTRMGAAIRYAAGKLLLQRQKNKLLLILTDGKPNDLDRYEGRYGIEDTRMAIREAGRQGIHPFCISIDDKANDYLPYIFGKSSYVFVRNVSELPYRLPKLYLRLVRG